jgi:heme A synthase
MAPVPSRRLLVRVLLVWAGGPAVYGLAGLVAADNLAAITAILSHGSVAVTPEMSYLVKPLSLYVMMFGGLLLLAATDPQRHRAIILWGALVFLLRGLQRGLVSDELNQLFHIPVWLNLLHVAYLFLLAACLWLLCPPRTAGSSRLESDPDRQE